MIDYRVEIGWHWIWFVVGPLLLTAPVVFWKNHRLDYVTGLCGLLIAITVIFWLADWNTADYVSLRLISHGDLIAHYKYRVYDIMSRHGGIQLSYVLGDCKEDQARSGQLLHVQRIPLANLADR